MDRDCKEILRDSSSLIRIHTAGREVGEMDFIKTRVNLPQFALDETWIMDELLKK